MSSRPISSHLICIVCIYCGNSVFSPMRNPRHTTTRRRQTPVNLQTTESTLCLSLAAAALCVHTCVQTGQNSSQGQADERMMQLLRLLNRPLERSPESRRRNLAWYTPVIVPVWPQVRAMLAGAQTCLHPCLHACLFLCL